MIFRGDPEILREDPDFVLCRGTLDRDDLRVLALTVSPEHSRLRNVEQLLHEYSLRDQLNKTFAAIPRTLVRDGGTTTLLLDDPGGQLLASLTGRPWQLRSFVHIAISLSTAIGRVHERGLIHKNIKPGNVLADIPLRATWLTGFGIASRVPRERQTAEPPDVMAGTLAYMAPEQTGRMNRSLDSRGDLYSLGVMLYELLTGVLPFTAADPLEWVHCHIAKQPLHPAERVSGVDETVSAIVLKLLAKSADDRYQTAAGVIADLQRCLDMLEDTGRVEPFPLGRRDPSHSLLMPGRLYGRDPAGQLLREAFDRVATNGAPELVLVSGHSGVGKSSLIQELHAAVAQRHGALVSGKVDQYQNNVPYSAVAQALSKLVRPVLTTHNEELARYRDAMAAAVGTSGPILVSLVPELEAVIGPQPAQVPLPPHDERMRLWTAVRRLLAVFASQGHPLTLFLDDLQWLDAATLDLVGHLVTHPDVRHVLFIGAYRANEMPPPLTSMVASARASSTRLAEIALSPLTPDELTQLISDALRSAVAAVRPLALVVHEKTTGNPFFATQFLMALAEERLLSFDAHAQAWQWDLDSIRAKDLSVNVVELMLAKLERLPPVAKEALADLAYLGHRSDTGTLATVRQTTEEQVVRDLWPAIHAGLVFHQHDSVSFLHDRVHEAGYALVPKATSAHHHRRLGHRLLARAAPENLSEGVFAIVGQLNRAVALVADWHDRERLAGLNLLAARRAKGMAAHASTLAYVEAGLLLVANDGWARSRELLFSLTLERAECDYVNGAPDHGLTIVDGLLSRADGALEMASVYRLKVLFHVMRAEYRDAVRAGLEGLGHLGLDLPPLDPTPERGEAEYDALRRDLGERSIESLVDLPLMTDPEQQAIALLCSALLAPTLFVDAHLNHVIVCRLMRVGLAHGMTASTLHACAGLAQIVGPVFQRYDDGLRFAKLACALSDKYRLTSTKGYFAMEVASVWTQPIAIPIEFIRKALRTATEAGDVSYVCYSYVRLLTDLLVQARDLDEAAAEGERALGLAREVQFRDATDMLWSQHRFIQCMRGRTVAFGDLGDASSDEATYESELDAHRMATVVAWYWILKLQARFMSGDHVAAAEAASRAAALLPGTAVVLQSFNYWYYAALNAAAVCLPDPDGRSRTVSQMEASLSHLRKWTASCPETFSDKLALVLAECARVEGRELDAMRLYEESIRGAREQGCVGNEGLANELAARFHAARGFESIALGYMRAARTCYERWGALGKVRDLDRRHPRLRDERAGASQASTFGVRPDDLDAAAIVRMSQVVSGEIVLERLVGRLMSIALEHAGATRGVLVLSEGDEYQLEAEATIDGARIAVRHRGSTVTPEDLPASILRLSVRLREIVLVGDARGSPEFSSDDYVVRNDVRAALCLPLVKQARVLGVLYLENTLAPHVFTPKRVGVLGLLASQAAISLQNARLYADLEEEVRERTHSEQRLRSSEAYLAKAQRLSATGSFGWRAQTDDLYWSAETYRLLAFDPAVTPSRSAFFSRVHPEDRTGLEEALTNAASHRANLDVEHRLLLPDGTVRHMHLVAEPAGDGELIGAAMDITQRKESESALLKMHSDLAHVARVATMGEMTASIAHEVNQPLAGIVTNAATCVRWLGKEPPEVDEARQAAERIIRDGNRAADVIARLRSLFRKAETTKQPLALHAVIHDVFAFLRSRLQEKGVVVRTVFAPQELKVRGDRIQVEQVLLNLILNACEAMQEVETRARELTVSTVEDTGQVRVTVRDVGTGFERGMLDQMFDAFRSTKPDGMGLGLSISRSIVEEHGGRISAKPNKPYGAVFEFTLPEWRE